MKPTTDAKPSVIEEVDSGQWVEAAVTAVIGLLNNDATGSVFVTSATGKLYRVTVEDPKCGAA